MTKPDAGSIVSRLPVLADGTPAATGMNVSTVYLGETWEAVIVGVSETTIDVRYTNAADHRAKGCTARLRPPREWSFVGWSDESPEPSLVTDASHGEVPLADAWNRESRARALGSDPEPLKRVKP